MLSPCYLGDELECIQPGLYRNVARQLNISVAMESLVSDALIGVSTEIFSTGTRPTHNINTVTVTMMTTVAIMALAKAAKREKLNTGDLPAQEAISSFPSVSRC